MSVLTKFEVFNYLEFVEMSKLKYVGIKISGAMDPYFSDPAGSESRDIRSGHPTVSRSSAPARRSVVI